MEIDSERIDAAVLALLLLGLHDGCRVWKGKAKSVMLTEDGQREAERLFAEMFAAQPEPQPPARRPHGPKSAKSA